MVRPTDAAEAGLFSERERNSVLKLYGSGPLTSPKTFQLHWRPTETIQMGINTDGNRESRVSKRVWRLFGHVYELRGGEEKSCSGLFALFAIT